MVVIRESPERAARLLQEALERDEEYNPRAPGLHATDLLHCPRKGHARLHTGFRALPTAAEDIRFASMLLVGQGFHAYLEGGVPEDHPILELKLPSGEVVSVTCSVDRIEWEPRASGLPMPDGDVGYTKAPGEIKSTRFGSKKPLIEQATAVDQVGIYALAYDTDWAVVYPLHILGAYGNDRMPDLKAWVVRFDEAELRAYRKHLVRRAAWILGDEVPPADQHSDFECEHCRLRFDFREGRGQGPLPDGLNVKDGWCMPLKGTDRQFFQDTTSDFLEEGE